MEYLTAVILGLVEGLTEFLPVSSTGHLILVNNWFHFSSKQFTDAFDIIIQIGAILAVVVFFWKRLNPFVKDAVQRTKVTNLWFKAIVGVVPVAIVAFVFQKIASQKLDEFIHEKLFFPIPVAAALVLVGAMIIGLELWFGRRQKTGIQPLYAEAELLPWNVVFYIGIIQCVALWPGTSRSAATLIGAMLLGASRVAAAEFSFFLAIPTLLGAGIVKLVNLFKAGGVYGGYEISLLLLGTVVAFFAAWAVVAFFMKFVQRNNLIPFGVYRIVIGVIVIVYFATQQML